MQFNRIVLVVYILLNLINYSYATTEAGKTMIRYYESFLMFSDNRKPIQGEHEISPEEINKYEAYFMEEIDECGNIISFKKFLNRKCINEVKYYYDSLGNLTKTIKQDCRK